MQHPSIPYAHVYTLNVVVPLHNHHNLGNLDNLYVQLNPVGPTSHGNPPITESILQSLEKFFFIFYIGNGKNPPITDKNCWSLEIRYRLYLQAVLTAGVNCT